MSSPVPSAALSDPPAVEEVWVPVDQRWLGVDKRTIRPALIVLGWAVLMALIVPTLIYFVPAGFKARPGDVLSLAGGVTIVPAPGWTVTDGVLVGQEPNSGPPDSTTISRDGVSLTITTAPFTGSPAALLTQLRASDAATAQQVVGRVGTIRTSSGEPGVVARYRTATSDGLIAAVVIDGVGVEVTVTGPNQLSNPPTQAIADMLTSITKD